MSRLRKTRHGHMRITDPGSDKPVLEVDTIQCCHCGGAFVPQPGSGRVRGFCQNCCGFICGPECAKCIPTEILLENYEKNRPLDFRPVVVSVSFGETE